MAATSSKHLSEEELGLAARDALEFGATAEHLEECESCWTKMDERRPGPKPRLGPTPVWLRSAAQESYAEFQHALARATEPPIAARVSGVRARSWIGIDLRFAAALGATAMLGVLLVVTIRPREDEGDVGIKGGGPRSVSADLYCRDEKKRPLNDATPGCASGAQLEMSVRVPAKRWAHVAFVVCDAGRCELVRSRALVQATRWDFTFENSGSSGSRRGILVLSNTALDAGIVERATRDADVSDGGPNELAFTFDAQQIPFAWSVSDAKKP